MIVPRSGMSREFRIEVSVTKGALDKLKEEKADGFKPKIDVWGYTTSKTFERIRTLNSYFFQLILRFSDIFDSEDYLPFLSGKVDRVYKELATQYNELKVFVVKPQVELNSWGISSLLFQLPTLKIFKDNSIQYGKEKFVYLIPTLIVNNINAEKKFPMKPSFSLNIASDLLRIEMDYNDEKWRFTAIQSKKSESIPSAQYFLQNLNKTGL